MFTMQWPIYTLGQHKELQACCLLIWSEYTFMYCEINNWKKNQVKKKHVRFLPMILLHSFHVNRPLTLIRSIPVYTCTCTWMIFILHTVVSCQKSTNVKVFSCLNFMAGEMWKNVWWAARPLICAFLLLTKELLEY